MVLKKTIQMNHKTAFITGATSGIGKATAQLFAQNKIRLILCGRRGDRLDQLKEELSQLTEVTTLQFDVSNREEVFKAIASLPNEFKKITEELEECKTKREEYLNGWKRERSDFLNHKKEEMERIGIIIKYANEELILKILPILDNIFLAERRPLETNFFISMSI